jgi:hypothetical protein
LDRVVAALALTTGGFFVAPRFPAMADFLALVVCLVCFVLFVITR